MLSVTDSLWQWRFFLLDLVSWWWSMYLHLSAKLVITHRNSISRQSKWWRFNQPALECMMLCSGLILRPEYVWKSADEWFHHAALFLPPRVVVRGYSVHGNVYIYSSVPQPEVGQETAVLLLHCRGPSSQLSTARVIVHVEVCEVVYFHRVCFFRSEWNNWSGTVISTSDSGKMHSQGMSE